MESLAGQLLDLRGLSKPRFFSVEEQQWAEWRFMFENWSALLGIDMCLAEAVSEAALTPSLEDMGPESMKVAKTVYHVLCLHPRGVVRWRQFDCPNASTACKHAGFSSRSTRAVPARIVRRPCWQDCSHLLGRTCRALARWNSKSSRCASRDRSSRNRTS